MFTEYNTQLREQKETLKDKLRNLRSRLSSLGWNFANHWEVQPRNWNVVDGYPSYKRPEGGLVRQILALNRELEVLKNKASQ